jgi:pimeloyl-ACP methyl ester carboxylesterase
MRASRVVLLILLAILVVGVGYGVARYLAAQEEEQQMQVALDPFYTPPDPIPSEVGTIIRREPLGVEVPGGRAERMLYVSERPDGTRAVSGGMLFLPDAPAPDGGRPIVAWEHGTLGMGDACVPSRSNNPLGDIQTFLPLMLEQGWVVVATDYVGLGTPGPNQYIIAQSEVRDVVNSVRAVRTIPEAQAGNRYATFGHSQGGHSSIWTGHLGPEYAPELELVGVAAAAPSLNLIEIASAQWNTAVGWVIGSALLESFPTYYPDLPVDSILTKSGQDNQARLAVECIKAAGIEALVREKFGEQFFSTDPVDNAQWRAALEDQTPPPMPASMPVFIAQGTADEVVLDWPNAMIAQEWCRAGSTLAMLWMGDVNHEQAAHVSGPTAFQWIYQRFAGVPAQSTCELPLPVAPVNPATS